MTRVQPFELDALNLAHTHTPLFEIAQARTIDDAVTLVVTLIEQVCAPSAIQITWAAQEPRVLAQSGSAPAQLPGVLALASLERGEISYEQGESQCSLFAPLSSRGELLGWIYLELPRATPELLALLQLIAGQLGPVITLHEATAQHGIRVRHLQTLTQVGQLLSGVLDLDSLMHAIYTATCQLVDVSNFYLAFYDPATDELELSYLVREGVRVHTQFRWPADQGLGGLVIRRRTPLHTDDYLAECARQGVRPRPLANLPVGRAWLGVPLFANDVPIGIMNISTFRSDYSYNEEHIELLSAIGAQAAVALANARLYRRNQRQAEQLAALNHIGRTINSSLDPEHVPSLIMEQVCKLMDVEEGSLLLVDETSGDLVFAYTVGPVGAQLLGQRIPRGRGVAGHVVYTGESVIANDVRGDKRFYDQTDKSTGFTTRSLLAVALRGVGGVQGVIEVMNRRDDSAFTKDDCRMLEAVADQAVIALENARRFAQIDRALAKRAQELSHTNAMLQHSLQSLTALNALSMAITSSLRDENAIFSMTAHGVVEASGACGAIVMLPEGQHFRAAVQIGGNQPSPQVEGVCHRVMQTGRPELLRYDNRAIRTLFAVPLRAPQRMVGVLCVFYSDGPPAPPDQETAVLFATQAASAVDSLNLFAEVRDARDQMASILASTREGILLIGANRRVALANAAADQLTRVAAHSVAGMEIGEFLRTWQACGAYLPDQWALLRAGLENTVGGSERFAFGHLTALDIVTPSIEWAALTVNGSQAEGNGVLLVLRDITEAREAERLRQDLTNMIVHDLRSPLSSVMAAIDMLVKGVSGELNDGQRGVLGIAYSSAVQMLEMINTLLDISRLEAGHMPIALGQHAVGPIVARAIERLTTLAQDRSIVIQTDLSAALPLVAIDRELVVRVVQNLLGNAIKFSSRGSTVLLRASLEHSLLGDMLRVSVSDRGVGIAPGDKEKIFAKFGQVGESRGGTGLGLTFCKLAIEAHGGQIWLESELGVGSTFFFTVPIAVES